MTKCVILAGGRGTRISEESHLKPKPMVEIGGKPILWHIMKYYSAHGVTDFVICLGYRGYAIKEYFANYFLHTTDVVMDLAKNAVEYRSSRTEPWKVALVDTGELTNTGGRLLRVSEHIQGESSFFLTYGDGLADVDLRAQLAFHEHHGRVATMTVVRPPARFGRPVLEDDRVASFEEKPQAAEGMINGGFFVCRPDILQHVAGDQSSLETDVLNSLVKADELRAWRHAGFWQPMDTLREKELLESMWAGGSAPWLKWS